jgi:HSP20 family protein
MDDRLRELRREAEALLARIAAAEGATPGLLRPHADVHEHEGHYVLLVEVPGVRLGEIQVYTQQNCLVVEGIKPSPELPKRPQRALMPRGVTSSSFTPVTYQCLEREFGPFRRTFVLPGPSDLRNARAELGGGVLTIRVPMIGEDRRNQRRQIAVTLAAPPAKAGT